MTIDSSSYADDIWYLEIVSDLNSDASGIPIVVEIPNITNPPCVFDLKDSWKLTIMTEYPDAGSTSKTFPDDCSDVESSNDPPLTSGLVTAQYRTNSSSNSMSIEGSLDGIGVTGATYAFELHNNNMVPEEGALVITVPTAVTVTNNASDFVMTCTVGCNTSANTASLSWNASKRELTITNIFANNNAVPASDNDSDGMFFSIKGWTNPIDSSTHDFYIKSYYIDPDDNSEYDIEYFSGLQITAKEGLCQIQSGYVTDSDTRIYAQPASYTFIMWCNHAIETDYGIRITWPSDYIIMDRSSCSFTGYSSRYYCQIFADQNILEVRQFTESTIDAQTLITFAIDSVINPGTFDDTQAITISTIDEYNDVIDTGTYTFD